MKTTPEEFILSHAASVYDPVKAHEYYLRTRQLKGRQKTAAQNWIRGLNTSRKVAAPKLSVVKPKSALITKKRQAEVQTRVKALRVALRTLNAVLNKLVADAKAADAPSEKKATKTRATKTPAAGKDRKPLTATEKREAAKKQKVRYRKEHPDAGKAKKDAERAKTIKEVKQKIEEVRSLLNAAIANARKLAAKSQPAATSRR